MYHRTRIRRTRTQKDRMPRRVKANFTLNNILFLQSKIRQSRSQTAVSEHLWCVCFLVTSDWPDLTVSVGFCGSSCGDAARVATLDSAPPENWTMDTLVPLSCCN